jgi:ABC-2 type transport system permease protein
MKKIFAIVWKDTLIRFSSPSEWLFFLLLPIVFTLILSGNTGGSGDSRVRLAVVDQARSPLSASLIEALAASDTVRPDLMTLEEAESIFRERSVPAVLIIPASFDLSNLLRDQVELEVRQLPSSIGSIAASRAVQTEASRLSSLANIARMSLAAAEEIRPFESGEARLTYFREAIQAGEAEISAAPMRMTVSLPEVVLDRGEYDHRAQTSAGQLITWVYVPLIGISGLFVYERQRGTLRRLLISPTRRSTFIFATIGGQVAMAFVQMLLLVGFGILVLKLNWGHSPVALFVILISAALAAAAMGTMLGTFIKSEGQASGLSIMLGMVMALLGGCWYPIEMFPQVARDATLILPTRWAMQGMLDLVLRGQGLTAILPEAGVLLGFAAVFFTIGVLRFRFE